MLFIFTSLISITAIIIYFYLKIKKKDSPIIEELIIILSVIMCVQFVRIVPKDHVAIGKIFGFDEKLLESGIYITHPARKLYFLQINRRNFIYDIDVISQDGFKVSVKFEITVEINIKKSLLLHKNIGPDYMEKVVKPEFSSLFRLALSKYNAQEIGQLENEFIPDIKIDLLKKDLKNLGIIANLNNFIVN